MFEKKEIGTIILLTIVLTACISFLDFTQNFLNILLIVFIILVLNIMAKKIAAYYFESEIEVRPWSTERYGFKAGWHFNNPFPIGIFLPIIAAVLSLGHFIWMAVMVFDVKPKVSRAAKRHGLYSFSEMTESHIGKIAAFGVFVTLISAFVAYFLGFPTFARLSIFFAFYNILPLSDLDGNKIFFGNMILWSFISALVLIGLGYAFFLV